ncbi:aldehyde dehydrogenase family protein, partial [Streptomyces sp. NPDC060187]|uniref:aldehyde dehydrogenase family protein n=1 Tax=Streptomyces sp. NPDC060187 TaxID=3347067 RepID=UPI00365A2FB9
LIVEESVRTRFVDELTRRARRIRLGRGTEEGVECGPLVSQAQLEKTQGFVASALEEGAVLRTAAGGGRRVVRARVFRQPRPLDGSPRVPSQVAAWIR